MRFAFPLPRLLHRIRLQHAIASFSLVLVLAFAGNTAASLHRSYRQTVADASEKLEGLARSAEVGTMRTIFEIDAMLLGLDRMLATLYSDAPRDGAAVKALLRQMNEQTLTVRDILLLDENGTQLNTAVAAWPRVRRFADRPFFTAQKVAGGLPSLFIGTPERSQNTGAWSMMVSRPLMRGDQFVGVIAAEVPTQSFTDFFNSIVTTPTMRLTLLLDDGTLLASEPHQEQAIGRIATFARPLLEHAARERGGLLATPAEQDDKPRLRAFRAVPARPLLVAASRERQDILAGWYDECVSALVTLALFAATAASLAWMLVRALDRQQATTSDLRRSEARLEEQTRLLQSTLEHMGEGLSVFDRHGRLVAWNERFLELLELPPDIGAGTDLREILRIQTARGDFGAVDVETEVSERWERFRRDPDVVRERRTPAGRVILLRRRQMPDGGVVGIYSDVTERKAAEEKLVEARNQAVLANRAKSEFLANMSHELRTPLNAIIGFSEMMRREQFGPLGNDRYKGYATDINESGIHLLDLINDVLDMSKIEAGKLELREEVISLRDAFLSTLSMMRERALARSVRVLADLDGNDVTAWADERAMKQILLNILSNAVKFSRDGGVVTGELRVTAAGEPVIEIRDQGIGMTEEELTRALEPFGQAQSTTTKRYEGTGLGLPITRRLVELHGGRLEIETSPGQGTLVRVVLPAGRRVEPEAIAETAGLAG
jgi:PAS domain S-box-containing protein